MCSAEESDSVIECDGNQPNNAEHNGQVQMTDGHSQLSVGSNGVIRFPIVGFAG